MKKLAAIIFAGLLATASVFAKPAFSSDIQVHTGIAFDEFYTSYSVGSETADTVMFDLDAQSWNMFQLNDLISVGFMAGVDFGWGGVSKYTAGAFSTTDSNYLKDAFHWNIIAAPAVSFSFKPVKLQCSFGFDFGIVPGYCTNFNPEIYSFFPLTFGFVTEVQAKFFPDKKFSPVCGYRFCLTGAGRIKNHNRNNGYEESYRTDTGLFSSGVLYIGASWNWK